MFGIKKLKILRNIIAVWNNSYLFLYTLKYNLFQLCFFSLFNIYINTYTHSKYIYIYIYIYLFFIVYVYSKYTCAKHILKNIFYIYHIRIDGRK